MVTEHYFLSEKTKLTVGYYRIFFLLAWKNTHLVDVLKFIILTSRIVNNTYIFWLTWSWVANTWVFNVDFFIFLLILTKKRK